VYQIGSTFEPRQWACYKKGSRGGRGESVDTDSIGAAVRSDHVSHPGGSDPFDSWPHGAGRSHSSAPGVWRWVQNIRGHYFIAFYRPEVSMDIQNMLTRSVAVTAGIAAAGLAIGAAAMGAFAIGALAIGALAVRKVAIRSERVEKLSVGELTVDRLLVKDSVNRE
jgi:hypothetical protein